MAATPSTMLALGTALPAFSLRDYAGHPWSDQDFQRSPALVVTFICPHCPFVQHIRQELARFAKDYQARGLAVVAINPNDPIAYPVDDAANMKREADSAGYTFPYLVDEEQLVARAFSAACTPDFFLFDAARRLVYRGQFDDSRPSGSIPVTGASLRSAADALLDGLEVPVGQRPSIGCSIKWKKNS